MGVILRQSLKGTFVNYVGALIGFITTMFIVTRYLQPQEIGLTRVLVEVATLFTIIAQLGTPSWTMRFFPYFRDDKQNHNGLLFYMLLCSFVGSVLFILSYIILDQPINNLFGAKSPLFVEYKWWVVPLTLLLSSFALIEVYSNVLLRITVPKLLREVILRIAFIVVYLLFAFHLINITGLVVGVVISYALCTLLGWLYLSRLVSFSLKHDFKFFTPKLRKSFFRYLFFVVIGGIGGTMINKLDIIMVGSQLGLTSAGIFTIALYMALIIEIPSRSISAISAPISAQAVRDNNFPEARRINQMVSLHQLLVGGVIFIYIWINIDNIFQIIPNGDIYSRGKWVVFFIGCSKLVENIFSFSNKIVSYTRYYYWTLFFTIGISLVTIGTNLLLIPRFGITGAAMATLLTCLSIYLLNFFLIVRRIHISPLTGGIGKFLLLLMVTVIGNHFLPVISNPWADLFYRSVIISFPFLSAIYFLRISSDLNEKVDSFLKRKQ